MLFLHPPLASLSIWPGIIGVAAPCHRVEQYVTFQFQYTQRCCNRTQQLIYGYNCVPIQGLHCGFKDPLTSCDSIRLSDKHSVSSIACLRDGLFTYFTISMFIWPLPDAAQSSDFKSCFTSYSAISGNYFRSVWIVVLSSLSYSSVLNFCIIILNMDFSAQVV